MNGLKPSECLFHTLVKPTKPVVDLKTDIHGITAADLENGISFEDAQVRLASLSTCVLSALQLRPRDSMLSMQNAILRLFSSSTIVVGHSLYGDFRYCILAHLSCLPKI